MLEEREIFFKNNWLKEFYLLNNITYKWKYDPISAAYAFIRLHPEATKGEKKENFPPSSAAPPTGDTKIADAYTAMQAEGYRAACELWDAIFKEIRPKIRDEDAAFILNTVRPDIAWRTGFTSKGLRFEVKCHNSDDTKSLVNKIDGILSQHKATFEKYGAKTVKYLCRIKKD